MAHLTNEPYLEQRNITKFLIEFAEELLRDSRVFLFSPRVDILVVGGSALAIKYNFRNTVDIDAQINCNMNVDKHINKIANKYKISRDWLNESFMRSPSYSKNLGCDATLVITRALGKNVVNIYVVSDLSQLCMKAVANRDKDIIDIMEILGIVKKYSNFKYRDYLQRMIYLYGSTKAVPEEINILIRDMLG